MSLLWKRRAVATLLALVVAWIPGHLIVVSKLGLDPWKWFGWAMYTVPKPACRAFVISMPDQQPLNLQTLPEEVRVPLMQEWDDFGRLRLQWGHRVEPTEFGRLLFDAFPAIDAVGVQVQRLQVRRDTAMYEPVAVETYVYARSELMGSAR